MRQILLATLSVSYILLITGSMAGARIFLDRSRDALIDLQDPDEVAEILQNLEENLQQAQPNVYNDVKRNIDLGFSRGDSGRQAVKHLMGLAAANHPSGPGRKRRAAAPAAPALADTVRQN